MIPLRDENPSRIFPLVTLLLIAANAAAFIYQITLGPAGQNFVVRFGAIPWEITHRAELPGLAPGLQTGWPSVVTLVSSMFLHGGILHLAGNMLYLWIFGDNVEDALGHVRYLVFYLASGLAAALLQAVLQPASGIPSVGASGAIAGVLGGYFVLYPRARVVTLVPLFFLFPLVEVPAGLYLLFWFLMQFWMGSADLASAGRHAETGGVAWWAHVGGFVAGLLMILVFRPRRKPAPRYRIV
jgi:hypothetical protein